MSPWVEPEGDFQVRFAPTAAVPLDAVFSYTVHQRLRSQGTASLRDAVDDVLDDGPLPGVLQAPVSSPVVALGNPTQGLVLDVPVRTSRNGSERVLLPTAGIHPVELRLTSAGGDDLWSSVVYLNRLPEDSVTGSDGAPGRLSVTLLTPVDGDPALGADGEPNDDVGARDALAGVTRLLTQVPEAPLTLALRPNVLTGVSRSDDPTDRAFLAAVRSPIPVATTTRWAYVDVDTGGLVAADAGGELFRQVALGDQVVAETTGRQPSTDNWYLDDTVSPESLELIKNLGATRVVVNPDRLRLSPNVPQESTRTMAVGLQGAPDMTATATDPDLTARLDDAATTPAQRANQIVTALMSTWFTAAEGPATAFPGPSSVIVVPADTDPAVVAALTPALGSGGPLSSDPAAVPDRPAVRAGRDIIAALTPRTPSDQQGPVDQVRDSRRLIDGYRSMAPAAQAEAAEWDLLNSESLDREMPGSERSAIHARISADISRRAAAIQPPRARRVVLTSRDSTIPLRFRNDLPVDVRLTMRTRSLRLEIDGGETREIVLKPGENRIDLPVVARASGGSLLRIDLSSPDGAIVLPATNVPVTSSTISGVGAALSVISLLFLAGWWIRTTRRRRRESAAPDEPDDGDHADGASVGHADPLPATRDGNAEPAGAVVGPASRPPDGAAGSVDPGG